VGYGRLHFIVIIFKDIGYALKPNLQEDGSKIRGLLNPV
jgi:hypothetical protein